ncbi:MAG: hypothetical protein U0Q15_14580 [Kineosporiaceae bacterium]
MRPVAHGVRTAAAAGCRALVLTNAAGRARLRLQRPGQAVLISDHLNLTGHSPLEGATFVDLTDLYAARLRAIAAGVAAAHGDRRPGGGVRPVPRPAETPPRCAGGVLGAGLVGMSTALEAIAARHAGMEVLGLSLVTNAAAGVFGEPLSHEEVLQAGRDAADRLGPVLRRDRARWRRPCPTDRQPRLPAGVSCGSASPEASGELAWAGRLTSSRSANP